MTIVYLVEIRIKNFSEFGNPANDTVSLFAEKSIGNALKRLLIEASEIFLSDDDEESFSTYSDLVEYFNCCENPSFGSFNVYKIAPDENYELEVLDITDQMTSVEFLND